MNLSTWPKDKTQTFWNKISTKQHNLSDATTIIEHHNYLGFDELTNYILKNSWYVFWLFFFRFRKDTFVQYLKDYIYGKLGKNNSMNVAKPPEDPSLTDLNITEMFAKHFNNTNLEDDITEKIRGFYPSCKLWV